MNAPTNIKRGYPTKAKIQRAVEIARECGLDVASIEVSPDGTIRVAEARAVPQETTAFDRWESEL